MHLRRASWMREELEASPLFVTEPPEHRGAWRSMRRCIWSWAAEREALSLRPPFAVRRSIFSGSI